MNKTVIMLLSFLVIGCAAVQQPLTKTEISDEVWEEISTDLAKLQAMVMSMNESLENKKSQLTVQVKSYEYPKDKYFAFKTVSGTLKYPIEKKIAASIPTKGGKIDGVLVKTLKTGAKPLWIVQEKEPSPYSSGGMASLYSYKGKEEYPVYAASTVFQTDPAFSAIHEFVSFEERIDKAYKEVTKWIKFVKEKYEDSPVYIDSFNVHIGIPFSIDIHFKIRD
jgi:hypothetical protein